MTYTTKQGDKWDGIAYAQCGSTSYTDKLIRLNQDYIDYYTFPAGVVLTLPDTATTTVSTLPPWKQVTT